MSRRNRRQQFAKKRQAKKAAKTLDTVEKRYKHVKKLGFEVLNKKFEMTRGHKRKEDKETGNAEDYIYAYKTFSGYKAEWDRFARFVAKRASEDDLESLESVWEFANRYFKSLMDKNRSASTLKTYKSALNKVFEKPHTAFIQTPKRKRSEIKRSRGEAVRDKNVSKATMEFYEKVCGMTGLRRREMEEIKGTALFKEGNLWYLNLTDGTKGGRPRKVRLMPRNKAELEEVVELFKRAKHTNVFPNVNTNVDIHSFRAEFARRTYVFYARDLNTLPRSEKTYCRGDLKGLVLDKLAEKKVSEALGHSRTEVFRKHYAWVLLQR